MPEIVRRSRVFFALSALGLKPAPAPLTGRAALEDALIHSVFASRAENFAAEVGQMKRGALTWCITLSAILCIILTGGWASAQNAQGLSAVGALDPANGYPRWYMDRTGLQLGQCLDTTSPADPCVMGVVAGSPAPPAIPNPGAPLSFPDNFPDEFFYWRTTADIANIGGVGGRAVLVMSTQAGFGGATGTAADGAGAQIVFARYRDRVRPNGLVPGATYTVTGPFGVP